MAPTPEQRLEWARCHYDKYATITAQLGLADVLPLIPATPERIREAIAAGDEHLNTIPLVLWDRAVGYSTAPPKHRPCSDCPIRDAERNRDTRPAIFRHTGFSVAEMVCTLKHVAAHHIAGVPRP